MKLPLPRSRAHGFTLIEMLTVMLIIAILASLVLGVNAMVQTKAARSRAEGEIKTLSLGIENYKVDNGTVPRNADTDSLDPRVDGNPATGGGALKYQKASLFLYQELSGDKEPAGSPDFKPENENKVYLPEFFKPNVLGATKDANGKITVVKYIQDPFGQSYGYSTKGAKAEEEYLTELRKSPTASRPTTAEGYNPTFDLWSTGGSTSGATAAQQGKWVKNW
jgi:prepilin-type N-terminal cleavage/methylation domain-containing protein